MTPTLLLAELGQRIVDDGPAAHHLLLQHLATLVANVAPGAAAALANPCSPPAVRQRALAVASAALLRLPDLTCRAALPGLDLAA
jgi:hypothetical protein